MPSNHCVPHSEETKERIRRAKTGVTNPGRRRPFIIKDGKTLWKCCVCGEFFEESDFYKNKRTILGIKTECKRCHCKTSLKSSNPEVRREHSRLSEANRRALKAGVDGHLTKKDMQELLNKWGFMCCSCGKTKGLEWDHIIPISRGGSHSIDNLQRLCSSCNNAKHTKTIDYRSDAQKLWVISFRKLEA